MLVRMNCAIRLCLGLLLAFTGCKSDEPPTSSSPPEAELSLLSARAVDDTIGVLLADPILVRVTRGGAPVDSVEVVMESEPEAGGSGGPVLLGPLPTSPSGPWRQGVPT